MTRTLTDKSQRSASSEIDLRGQTIEEGIMMVDQYIDSCLLMGIKTITIIHGKGTGALRNAIQQHLKIIRLFVPSAWEFMAREKTESP